MRKVFFFAATIIAVLVYSCRDTSTSSFEEAVPEVYTITTSSSPEDGGEVIPSTDEFPEGSKIEVEAMPSEGWIFAGWEGDLQGSINPDSLSVDGDKNITALFIRSEFELNIEVIGEGRVRTEELESKLREVNPLVVAEPSEVPVKEEMSEKMKGKLSKDQNFLKSKPRPVQNDNSETGLNTTNLVRTVELTAEPFAGWEFTRWEGDLEGSENPATIVVDEDKSITAIFDPSTGSSSLVIIQQPTETSAGTPISPAPEIEVSDGQGNPIENVEITVSEQGEYNFNSGTLTLTTDADGQVAFNDLVINQAGSYRLVFNADEVGQTTSSEFTVIAATGDSDQTTATVPNGAAGEPTNITITVEDAFGNRVTGAAGSLSVSITSGPNSGAPFIAISHDGNGVYTTSYTPTSTGTDQVTIQLDGTGISGSPYPSNVTTSDADAVEIQTQPGQTTAGQSIAGPPAVLVTDAQDNPVEGVDVAVSEQGGYSFDSGMPTATTGSNGIAIFNDLVISTVGTYTLVFNAVGVTDNATSSEFTVVAAAGEPAQTTATVPNGAAGEPTNIAITVADAFGNRVTGAAGSLSVSVSGPNGGATVGSITHTGNGVYSTSYTPTSTGTDNIAIRLNGSHISGSPYSSTVLPGDPVTFVLNSISSPQTAGSSFSITITAEDSEGNTAANYNGSANLSTTAGSIIPASVNFSNGVATSMVTVTDAESDRTITVADGAITGTSNAFDVVAGPPSMISIVTNPEQTTAGQSIAGPPTVRVTDANNNPVNGVNVTVSEQSGYNFDSGTLSISTGSNGRAVFNNLVINETGTYTLVFNAAGVGQITSNDFTVVAGPPANIGMNTQPGTTTAGEAISPFPSVTVEDTFGNPVAGVNVTVTLNKNDFTGSSTTNATTNGSGIVTFNNLIIEIAETDYTLSFSADGESTLSDPFDITAAEGDPSSTTADVPSSSILGQPVGITIIVRDQFGNRVTGVADDLFVEVTSGPNVEAEVEQISDDGNGVYTTSYDPDSLQLGTDEITIQLNGTPINGGSTYSVIIISL